MRTEEPSHGLCDSESEVEAETPAKLKERRQVAKAIWQPRRPESKAEAQATKPDVATLIAAIETRSAQSAT